MLGYNTTIIIIIRRTNIKVLLNIGSGTGGGRKKEVKKKQPSLTELLTMIVWEQKIKLKRL